MKKTTIYRITLLIQIILIISSCGTEKKEIQNIEVDIDDIQKVSFFDIFSKATIIPLETNDSSLIRNITKIIPFNNKFYILDYIKAEILFFDESGRYLSKIRDKGDGPNQYVNISDFDIDRSRNILICLSPVNNTMYEYDLSGNFLRKYKLPDIKGAYNRLKYLNQDILAFWTFDYNNRVKFYSKNKNSIIKETFAEVENIANNFTPFVFPYANYLCRSANNTVYEVTDKTEVIEKYYWNFSGTNNSKRQIKKLEEIPQNEIRSFTNRILNSEIINYVFSLQGATNQYYYTQIWRKGKRINIFHDKMNGNNYVFDKTIEDAGFYPLFWHNDYVLGFHYEDLGNIEETIPNKILDEQNIEIKKRIGEYDNPILIKYHF
jgi:hypothetical protein